VISFGCVARPEGETWRDATPALGVGTSGTGEVLAAAVGGVGARSHGRTRAACCATLTHRVAATRLARRTATGGYLARERADEPSRPLAALTGAT